MNTNTDFWNRVIADFDNADTWMLCEASPSFETAFDEHHTRLTDLAQRFLDSDDGAPHRATFAVGRLFLFRSRDNDNVAPRTQHRAVRKAFLNWALKNDNDDTTP